MSKLILQTLFISLILSVGAFDAVAQPSTKATAETKEKTQINSAKLDPDNFYTGLGDTQAS